MTTHIGLSLTEERKYEDKSMLSEKDKNSRYLAQFLRFVGAPIRVARAMKGAMMFFVTKYWYKNVFDHGVIIYKNQIKMISVLNH